LNPIKPDGPDNIFKVIILESLKMAISMVEINRKIHVNVLKTSNKSYLNHL
jgi:hypothetical protein